MRIVPRDLWFAWRKLAHRPGTAALAILSLALAIGFTTAAFSVFDAVYWRALPVADPGRLAHLAVRDREGRFDQLTWPEFESIQRQARPLAGIAVQDRRGPRVRLPDRDDFPITACVSDNFFDVLGVGAAIGRVFHAGAGRDGEVVITDRYWKTAFGGDRSIVGRSLPVRGAPLTIIGVLPPEFTGTQRGLSVSLFVPQQAMFGSLRMNSPADGKSTDYEPVIRLRPGATLETARVEIDQVLRRMETAGQAPDAGRRAFVISFAGTEEAAAGGLFLAVVSLILMIAAANLANLRLVDNQLRRRETGIRLALGAGRWRLFRGHLAESLLLAASGTALGLLVAAWLIDLAPAVLFAVDRYLELYIRFDARVLAFSAGALILVAVMGALIPLRDAWKCGVKPALQAVTSPAASRWLSGLVLLQMVLATAAASTAGLLWRSFQNVAAIRPAMDPGRQMLIVEGARGDGPRWAALAGELNSIPGVVRVAYARRAMISGSGNGLRTTFERPGEPKLSFRFNQVSPSYFATTGARILRGRSFSDGDGPNSTPVVMVSQAFVHKFFGEREAVGVWVRLDGKGCQIVGVVEDGPSAWLKEEIEPFVYFPFAQRPSGDMTYFLETAKEAGLVTAAARARMRQNEAAFVAHDFHTMAQHMRAQRIEDERAAEVFGALALLGVALATAGLFGVTLYAVSRRTREFGVRLAMGATPSMLSRQVVREALRLALAGVALGILLVLAAQKLLASFLYGVQAGNPWTLAGAGAAVALVALAAALVPARRAARVNPIEALRYE